MKKILAVAFTFLVLTGCLGPKGLVGSEYQMVSGNGFLNVIIGFRSDGIFYSNSINAIEGNYQVNGDKLALAITKKTNLTDQSNYSGSFTAMERRYVSMLPKINSFKLDGKHLTLNTYDGRSFEFERIGRATANTVQ